METVLVGSFQGRPWLIKQTGLVGSGPERDLIHVESSYSEGPLGFLLRSIPSFNI